MIFDVLPFPHHHLCGPWICVYVRLLPSKLQHRPAVPGDFGSGSPSFTMRGSPDAVDVNVPQFFFRGQDQDLGALYLYVKSAVPCHFSLFYLLRRYICVYFSCGSLCGALCPTLGGAM